MTRLAIVTGSSRGIGAAVARELLERGWTVQGIARGEAAAGLDHERYRHGRVDLADLPAVEAWFGGPFREACDMRAASRVALVNTAGALAPVGPATELAARDLLTSLAVNVAAPAWLAGFVLREAAPAAAVRVVNLSSGAATKAYPGWTAYCCGKAALQMAGEVLAEEVDAYSELSERDVAVVSYAPHVVETAMQEELRGLTESVFPLRQRFVDLQANGQLVPPEGPAREIAELVERDDLPRHTTTRYMP